MGTVLESQPVSFGREICGDLSAALTREWVVTKRPRRIRFRDDSRGALQLLQPFEHHLRDAGLGTISGILEGDPPHHPRGCIAQAWSVAEVLRVWRKLAQT